MHLGKCLAMGWAAFARINMVRPGYIVTDSTCTLELGRRLIAATSETIL